MRNNLGLSREDFAKRLGLKSRGKIENIELSRTKPDDAFIHLICREFNVNEDWLRTGEGNMFTEENFYPQLKGRIKAVRKVNKMTQIEFGQKIGIKGNTVTNYETGLRNPSDAIIKSICREFNVNEHWLRTGEGEMFSEPFGNSNMSERLKILRKELGMTQQEFASRLNLSRNFINQVENRSKNISIRTISDICTAFSINEYWLRTGTGEMFTHQTDDEQLTSFIVKILANKSTSFKRKFISMLSALDESDWDVLEKMVTLLKKED